jgi:tetratricopeptide (TPR) repeat protein
MISGIFLIPTLLVVVLLNRVEEQAFISPVLATSNQKNLLVSNSEEIVNNPLADPYYKFKVGLNLIDAGYFDKGVSLIKKLSEEDSRQLDYLKVLIRAEMTQNNLNEAVKLRETSANLDPWNAQNYFELAKLYKLSGDLTKVEEMRDKILSFAPNTEIAKNAIEILA